MTRICSNDPTHDIGAAGPTGGFCPVCGRPLIDAARPVSGATDDLTDPARPPRPLPEPVQPRQPPPIAKRPSSRTPLYLVIAAVVLAAGIALVVSRMGRSATHEFDLPDGVTTNAIRSCAFQNVVVSFKTDGSALVSGRASGKHGPARIGFSSLQMSVAVYATIQAGLKRNVYTVSIPGLMPSAAPVSVSRSFGYDASLFPTISDAAIDVQCNP